MNIIIVHVRIAILKCICLFLSAVTCSELSPPNNGQVLYAATVMLAPFNFGTAATYLCGLGYALVGNAMSRCGSDGSSPSGGWSGTLPTCQGGRILVYSNRTEVYSHLPGPRKVKWLIKKSFVQG